jgi:hypothetical protein
MLLLPVFSTHASPLQESPQEVSGAGLAIAWSRATERANEILRFGGEATEGAVAQRRNSNAEIKIPDQM